MKTKSNRVPRKTSLKQPQPQLDNSGKTASPLTFHLDLKNFGNKLNASPRIVDIDLKNFGNKLNEAFRQAAKPIKEPGIDGVPGYIGNLPISLTVFDCISDATLAGCDITKAEWKAIKRHAAERKTSVGALLKAAVVLISEGVQIERASGLILSLRRKRIARCKANRRA